MAAYYLENQRNEREAVLYANQQKREEYEQARRSYNDMLFFQKWLTREPREPIYENIPDAFYEMENSARKDIIYTRGLEVCNVPNMRGIRFHAGSTCGSSRGCLIVGEEILEMPYQHRYTNYEQELHPTPQTMHYVNLAGSFRKAEELSKLLCCIEEKKEERLLLE